MVLTNTLDLISTPDCICDKILVLNKAVVLQRFFHIILMNCCFTLRKFKKKLKTSRENSIPQTAMFVTTG